MRSPKQLRYFHLLAAGASVFLGLDILGDLLGVLRHVEVPWMFGGWVTLSPSAQEWVAVWVAWGACLLISTSPSIAALAHRKTRPEPIVVLAFFISPLLSLLITLVSPHVGATLLVGSGFLVGYVVTSRSRTLLGIDYSSAQRLVCTVVFGLFALTAAAGVICVLLWQAGAFLSLSSSLGRSLTDVLLGVFAVDLKAFYLAEPLLTALFLTIALVAIVVLFMDPARRLVGLFVKLVAKERFTRDDVHVPQYESEIRSWLAYLTLAGAFGLAIAVTVYPILQLHWPGGADFPWYASNLRLIGSLLDVVSFLRGDRGLFLLLLSLTGTAMGVSAGDVVRFAPAVLSVLLALSTFLLVREGTGRLWVSSFAALLSVVSVQTTLGMYGGILANWFALSIVNFTFAMVIRSVRLRSPLAAVGSIVLSLVLLTGYAYAWVVAVVELLLALIGSLTAFRASHSNEWKYDVGIISGVILGIVLVPFVFASIAATPLVGLRLEILDPNTWFALGWRYALAAGGQTIGSMLSALEFSLAESWMELPFVALLSVLGLLDHAPRTRCFTGIIAAMVLVPFAIELVPNAPSYYPLRGLYLIPLYMLAALGAESVIRRVNEQESSWKIRTGLAFAGAFAAYLFLSQLGYTLMMFGLPLLPLP
jgi:hypothetical protein